MRPTYRDWQNSETCFEAVGTDIIPGVRLCSNPAKTLLDSGTDTGNFRGVAIYVQGQEVVLVSEMQAGWYRYISEWRLHADGTIRPRFGFSAINNPCTCKVHHHHAYWRLDFDIARREATLSRNSMILHYFPACTGITKKHEIRHMKDNTRHRKWRVRNTLTGEGYELIPGPNNGTASNYGVGDIWVLKYHGAEIDDGVTYPHKRISINFSTVKLWKIVMW